MILTLTGNGSTPDGGVETVGPITIVGTLAPSSLSTFLTLQAGQNTVQVPANAAGCVITPPPGNQQALRVATVNTDTGIPIPPNFPSLLRFPANGTPATLYLTAGGTTSSPTTILFF